MRFYEPNIDKVHLGSVYLLNEENSHHFAKVLRGKTGQSVQLFSGNGGEFSATVDEISKKKVTVSIVSFYEEDRLPQFEQTLVVGLTNKQKMALIIQKATELGVSQIQPLITERTQGGAVGQFSEDVRRRYEKIIISAAMQSGLNRLPELKDPKDLDGLPWSIWQSVNCYICDPQGKDPSLIKKGDSIWLIGPEGGWSDDEVRYLVSKGCEKICLAKTVLRMETAAICALFLGGV